MITRENKAQNKFRDYLSKRELKFTPERKMILKTILSLHTHFDVDELYQELTQEKADISRATIYRTLPLLLNSGIIKQTLLCQDKSKYEYVFGHRHHDHMLCITCGQVIEFRDEQIEKRQAEVCKKYGFQPVEHRLGIRGYRHDSPLRESLGAS